MKQVLYAEESATAQLAMRKCLRDVCALTIAGTVLGAETTLRDIRYDLLITAFAFPEGNALRLIQAARRGRTARDLPILVLSGPMGPLQQAQVLKAGANDIITRPLRPREFRKLVERMLSEPFVRVPDPALHEITCFQWRTRDRFFQHCPELDQTVSGATKSEAAARMQELIEENARNGFELGVITQQGVVTHVLQD